MKLLLLIALALYFTACTTNLKHQRDTDMEQFYGYKVIRGIHGPFGGVHDIMPGMAANAKKECEDAGLVYSFVGVEPAPYPGAALRYNCLQPKDPNQKREVVYGKAIPKSK